MANRDHSLDDGIIQAAYSEFLAYGFQKASLHKIAEKAGVTTGAIYTRYKNKDALFASLLQDYFETMQVLFTPVAEEYERAKHSAQPEDIRRDPTKPRAIEIIDEDFLFNGLQRDGSDPDHRPCSCRCSDSCRAEYRGLLPSSGRYAPELCVLYP